MKTCTVCRETKPMTEYYKNHRCTDGLTPHCKSCNRVKDMQPRNRFSRARAQYRRYKIDFTITVEWYEDMCKKPCHYCGGDINNTSGHSMDRVDRTKGYVPENIVPCCWLCNNTKGATFDSYEMGVLGAHFPEFQARRARLGLPPLAPPDHTVNRTQKNWLKKAKRKSWEFKQPN